VRRGIARGSPQGERRRGAASKERLDNLGADPVTRMVCLLVHDLNKSLSQAKIAHLLGRNRKSIIRWAKIGRELAKNREQKCA
jgi:hypothetical protein